MPTLIVIKYRPENLNNLGKTGSQVIKQLTGLSRCHFLYHEPDKFGKQLVRIDFVEKNWSVVVGIAHDQLSFVNPWFRRAYEMEAVLEGSGFMEECNIYFAPLKSNTTHIFIEQNAVTALTAAHNIVLQCLKLKKPVVSANVEKDKEIWTAYCDGLNALNKEHRVLIRLDRVGSAIAYNDTRKGDIYTMKLDTLDSQLAEIPTAVKRLLGKDYRLGNVALSDDRQTCTISFKGLEKVNEDDIERMETAMNGYGFSLSKDGAYNVLRATVCLPKLKDRMDVLVAFDQALERKVIGFANNESLHYYLADDTDAEAFEETVTEVFGEDVYPLKITEFNVPIGKKQAERIRELLKDEEYVAVAKKNLLIQARDREEYTANVARIAERLVSEKIFITYPEYKTTYVLKEREISIRARRKKIEQAEVVLEEVAMMASGKTTDAEGAYAIQYTFHFKNSEEREYILQQLGVAKAALGSEFYLVVKNKMGYTEMTYEYDPNVTAQLNEELKADYQGKEMALVDGRVYNHLFSSISDPDNITDTDLREQYNRFMRECPTIGVCHKRTRESIIVALDEEFFDGDVMLQEIRKGDMVFFPSVGDSTEIRRQADAMLRINKPGQKLSGGRVVEPPVNAKLCQFLFNPIYARSYTKELRSIQEDIRQSCIEKHLNERQVEAVAKAISAPDIAFIQGPPGTGKTTVIAEIIWQEIRRNPKCKILLTSQTNLAVDNALERLKYKPGIRPVRIISGDRVSDDDLRYNTSLMDDWAAKPDSVNENNVVNTIIGKIVDRIKEHPEMTDETREWCEDLEARGTYIRKMFVEEYKAHANLVAATCSICGSYQFSQMYSRMYNQDRVEFDVVIMDEASKATPLEMAVPMVLGKKIVVIGDHRQLPPMLDENSLDTLLKKIGREDLATRILELKESQFKKLFLQAQKFRPELITTLDTQYRMHKTIMQTITHFYEEELGEQGLVCGIEDVMDNPDITQRGSRYHGISCEPFISSSTHAIWVNVSGKEQKDRMSFKNVDEVHAVKTIVKALTEATGFREYIRSRTNIEDKEIGLITFYSAQKWELKRLVANGGLNALYDYRVDVVDRFQGMERNIVIVSTVRSNAWRGIGFAKEIERINVAFSRARTLLIVVGNKDMFENKYNYKNSIRAMETIDIRQIEDLIRNHHEQ